MSGTKIFISYSRPDDNPDNDPAYDFNDPETSFIAHLHKELETAGHDVWWDRASMQNRGQGFLDEIRQAIDEQDHLVLVLGPHAIQSEYVRAEWLYALNTCKVVIPLIRHVHYAQMPPELASFHAVNFQESRKFEEALAELLRLLGTPIIPMGAIPGVPHLPENYLYRPDDVHGLERLLLTDVNNPTRMANQNPIALLHGMGGIGKSSLAAEFARACNVRRTFTDGIFWFSVGQEMDNDELMEYMGIIGTQFGDDESKYRSHPNIAKTNLNIILKDKHCLIVLDDIWKVEHTRMFIDALGPHCRILITTRNEAVALDIGAAKRKIDVLSPLQAVNLLETWAGKKEPDHAAVAKSLGYLPLGLKLAGSRLKQGVSAKDWLQKFNKVSRITLHPKAHERDTSLTVCFELSVNEAFADDEYQDKRPLYHTLGIFPEDNWIPQDVVIRLWQQLQPELDEYDCEELIEYMSQLALIDYDVSEKKVALHDLLHSYNLEKLGNERVDTHHKLLEAYAEDCTDGWCTGPDDHYYFSNLAYHMIEAEQADELRALLFSFRWMRAKLHLKDEDVVSLLDDYDTALADRPDEDLELIRKTLRLSAHVLADDESQLASQLVGRLLLFADRPAIQTLLGVIHPGLTWLKPLRATLMPPGAGLVQTMYGHTNEVWSVGITWDGRMAVSAGVDFNLKVWEVATGYELRTLKGHTGTVNTLDVSRDGKMAASASNDMTVILWDLETGKAIRTFKGHTGPVLYVDFNDDGSKLMTSSADHTVIVWNLETGDIIRTIKTGSDENDKSMVWQVLFNPKGDKALTVSTLNRSTSLWNLDDGALLHEMKGHNGIVVAAAFMPDSKTALTSSADATIRQWDMETGKELGIFGRHDTAIWALEVSEDSKFVVSASSDHVIKVWDVPTRTEIFSIDGHSAGMWDAGISADGSRFVTGSDDMTVKIWSLDKAYRFIDYHPEKHGIAIRAVALNPANKTAIIASADSTMHPRRLAERASAQNASPAADHTLKIWDLASMTPVHTLEGHTGTVWSVAVTEDGRTAISASADRTLKVWNLETNTLVRTLTGHTCAVRGVAISADGVTAVSASTDGTVRVWDVQIGAEKHILSGHDGALKCIALTADAKYAVTGAADAIIKIWDIESGEEIRTLEGHDDWVRGVAVTPDGKRIVSGSYDGTVRVWDFQTGRQLKVLKGHEEEVIAVAVDADGKNVISASVDFMLKVWNINTGECETTFTAEGKLFACAIASGDLPVLAGGTSGLLHILELNP